MYKAGLFCIAYALKHDFGYPYRIVGFFSHKYFILFAFPDLNGTEPRFHSFRYPRFYYDDI
jgi:hypothetical protein